MAGFDNYSPAPLKSFPESLNRCVGGSVAEADGTQPKNVVYGWWRKRDLTNPLIIQTRVGVGYELAAE